jgi:uncharacterized membrane protein
MNKTEYVNQLEKLLAGKISPDLLQDTIRYYREYIDFEIRKGRAEQEVLDSLGDPRLIAKSIITANEEKERQEFAQAEMGTDFGSGTGHRNYHIPLWIVLIFVFLVLMVILSAVFSIVGALAPVLLPVLLIVLIVRFFSANRRW